MRIERRSQQYPYGSLPAFCQPTILASASSCAVQAVAPKQIGTITSSQLNSIIRRGNFLSEYPIALKGLQLGYIKADEFIKDRVVIPFFEDVVVHHEAVRSEKLLRAAIEHGLQEKLRAKLDDPALQKAIYEEISAKLYESIEESLDDRSAAESNLEWLMNSIIGNRFSFHTKFSKGVEGSFALCVIEGGALVKNERAWIAKDNVTFTLDLEIKVISFDRKVLTQLESNEKLEKKVSGANVTDRYLSF